MARKKYPPFPPGERTVINCFAIRKCSDGSAVCSRLETTFCRYGEPCSFFATPEDAERSRHEADERLRRLEKLEEYREVYGTGA